MAGCGAWCQGPRRRPRGRREAADSAGAQARADAPHHPGARHSPKENEGVVAHRRQGPVCRTGTRGAQTEGREVASYQGDVILDRPWEQDGDTR
ncbi:hypothetical protein SCYAM73S_01051 [Streptomyces cyaneofuscatus]